MKQTELIMGMPITVELVGGTEQAVALRTVFDYFRSVDERFSPYKPSSEVSQVNQGKPLESCSQAMRTVMALCEATKAETGGYFDIRRNNRIDPSGLVKGWAIHNAATILRWRGFKNFSIEAGGDFQLYGHGPSRAQWRIGIRNPRNRQEIIKVLYATDRGIATSGTAIRGQHIYNPLQPDAKLTSVLSLTVIGPNIYDADRYATAAFAMGDSGLAFIESLPGFEGYAVKSNGTALLTSGLEGYTI